MVYGDYSVEEEYRAKREENERREIELRKQQYKNRITEKRGENRDYATKTNINNNSKTKEKIDNTKLELPSSGFSSDSNINKNTNNNESISRVENNIKEEKENNSNACLIDKFNLIDKEKECIKNNIKQIQEKLKNGKSLLEIYNTSASSKNLFSFSDFEKEFVEQVISLDSNNLKTHLDEDEAKISSKTEALKHYKEKIKNNYKKIKIDVLNGIPIEDIYKTYINSIHSDLFNLAEFKQSCFDEFKRIKEEEKKALTIKLIEEEMKNKAEEITFLKVFTVMLFSGIAIMLILVFIASFLKIAPA